MHAYLGRRSALELAILDGLIVAAGLWSTLPAFTDLDPTWMAVLVVLAPSLMVLSRAALIALSVPDALSVAALDPSVRIVEHPRLDEARSLTGTGLWVLAATALGSLLAIAAVGVTALARTTGVA